MQILKGRVGFKLKIKDKSELDSLMSKDEYDKFCKENPS